MRNLLILLAFFLVSLRTSALPSFDPFADATANGGTSYTVGSTLTNQFNPALFAPWYSRGGSFGSTTPLIVSGNLSYPGLDGQQRVFRSGPQHERMPGPE